MIRSKQNRRKPNHGRRACLWLAFAAANTCALAVLLAVGPSHAQARGRAIPDTDDVSEVEDVPQAVTKAQAKQPKAKASPAPAAQPTPTAATLEPPATPPGLVIGAREVSRDDVGEWYYAHHVQPPLGWLSAPPSLSVNAANVSAYTSQEGGTKAYSFAPLWLDSPQATHVEVNTGGGLLMLDGIGKADDVISVRVHDEYGAVVTFSQRALRRITGAVEAIGASVRVDDAGRLLALPTIRLDQAADGSVILSRDGSYNESLTVEYRYITQADPHALTVYPWRFASIPAGAEAVTLADCHPGDTLTLLAGDGFTPAPAEGSDVLVVK